MTTRCRHARPSCWHMATHPVYGDGGAWARGCLEGHAQASWRCPFVTTGVPLPRKPIWLRIVETLTGQKRNAPL